MIMINVNSNKHDNTRGREKGPRKVEGGSGKKRQNVVKQWTDVQFVIGLRLESILIPTLV